MATYVTSDAHGHVQALDRALELAGPGSGDVVYVLGDMVDRGPDPVGVLRLVRSLPNARVLMGNHERMLLDTLMSEDEREVFIWEMNGGSTTARGLDSLASDEAADLIDWIAQLPLFDVVEVDDRRPGAAAPGRRSSTSTTSKSGSCAIQSIRSAASSDASESKPRAVVDPPFISQIKTSRSSSLIKVSSSMRSWLPMSTRALGRERTRRSTPTGSGPRSTISPNT